MHKSIHRVRFANNVSFLYHKFKSPVRIVRTLSGIANCMEWLISAVLHLALLVNACGAGSGVAEGREGRGAWCGARGCRSAAGQRGRGREVVSIAAILLTTSRTRGSTRSTLAVPETSSPRCRTRMHDDHYTYVLTCACVDNSTHLGHCQRV